MNQHGRDALSPEERKQHRARKRASRMAQGKRVHVGSGLTNTDVQDAIERVKARREAGIPPKRGVIYDLDKLREGIDEFDTTIQMLEEAIEDASSQRREWRALLREQEEIQEKLRRNEFVEGYSKEPGVDTMPDLNT